jgi:PAS domain S-box-containing protein
VAIILIVDDNPTNRSLLVALLSYSGGYSLREISNGAESLARVFAEHPDLVIADITMPTTDAYEFVRRLRSTAAIGHTTVPICPAHFLERDAIDLTRVCRVECILTKLVDSETVFRSVAQCLPKGIPMLKPVVAQKFAKEHLRLITDKLSAQTPQLTSVNRRLEALIDISLRLASQTQHERLLENFCVSALFWGLGAVEFSEEDERLAGISGALAGRIYENGRMYSVAQRHVAELGHEMAERKNAEEALRASEARHRLYFENSPLPGWLYDVETLRFLDVNGAATLHYGYSREEFLSMTIKDIQLPEDAPKLLDRMGQISLGVAYSGRWKHRKKDGTVIDVEVLSYSLDSLRPVEFVLVSDVSERVRNEALVQESSECLNMALRASRTGVWSFDAVKDQIVCDAHTSEILGISPGSFGGTSADLLARIHPEDRDIMPNPLTEGAQGRSEIAIEFRVVWPDGSVHHIASRGQAFFNEDGGLARVSGVSHDITEQRLLEEELRQSQKMEAIGRLAAGIAHDFNNVLTVITGYCSLLLTNPRRQKSVPQALREMLEAGRRAAALTGQLLAFGRKQVLQPQLVNLGVILEEVDGLVRHLSGEDIEVATNIDQDLANVRADPNQVQQVILNLVTNARDAMPKGGTLMLELKNMELDEIKADRSDVPRGRYVLLAISDNGVGMKPEVRRRAFEPFFTTKETGRGTGLGLSTVYGIVKQSGGYISLDSEPGVGTTFRIFLPRVDEQLEPGPSKPIPALHGGHETILVVEDDPEVRALVREILDSVGYNIIVAEDGEDAMRVAAGYAGDIRLLLTDVVMQKMGGRQSAEHLIAIRPEMKVLYMSGYTSDEVLHHGILDQKVHFLAKPFTSAGLCSKVRAVLDSDVVIQRILVVDDDRSIRQLLAAILVDSGFEVIIAGDGREARAKARQGPIDLVITDLAIPKEDCIEMVRHLRSNCPHLKIIAMSGAFGPDVIEVFQMLGADIALSKPLTPASVLQCIDDVRTSA